MWLRKTKCGSTQATFAGKLGRTIFSLIPLFGGKNAENLWSSDSWKKGVILIIIIIIMSCHRYGYTWPSLATSPNRSLPLASLQGYIPNPHVAAVCMLELVVLLLPSHMWGSMGVHPLWARPCFSSSVLHVWFIWLV